MIDPERLFVHVPYAVLAQYRHVVQRVGLPLEVFVEAENLEVSTLEALAAELSALKAIAGRVAIHAPYEDIDPGHPVEDKREEALRLLTMACALAQATDASYVVAHTGYDPTQAASDPAGWLARSLETWQALLAQPASDGVVLALEHMLEPEPSLVRALVESLPAHRVGVCLDTGHLNCFARSSPPAWWAALGDRIAVLHLHDNRGQDDEHLGIGEGTFDFGALFRWLQRSNSTPFATIEGRDPQAVVTSLSALGYPVDLTLLDGA
ncbi:MAG: sugar phosphate isomerase/epimerase family protein [bacterium]|nr:sugar phosphate isomerase/epimerase family protein [bacterium]